MKKSALLISCLFFLGTITYAQDIPNAEVGKCYAKCLIPEEYQTITDQIEIKAAQTINKVAKPQYETVTHKVMIKPASIKYEAVAATYSTTTEEIMVKEASTRVVVGPGEYQTYTNSYIYSGTTDGISVEMGDILDPGNPNSPNQIGGLYHPNTPGSLSNMNDPNNPYNPSSPYYGSNIKRTANQQGGGSGSGGLGGGVDDGFLMQANVGAVLPYVTKEATVSVDKVPYQYTTTTETIEVSPASLNWEKKKVSGNCISENPEDCFIYCYVEKPAQFKTITKTMPVGCPAGYYESIVGNDSKPSCIKVNWQPAKYGPRTVMVKAPTYRTEPIPAQYKTITKTVVNTPATYKKVVVPAEYKTVTTRVRKGLKEAGMVHPTGTMLVGSDGDGSLNNPVTGGGLTINPMAGYPLDEQYTAGDPAVGDIDHVRLNEGTGGINVNGPNAQSGYWSTFYTAGCPSGFTYDPIDNLCKSSQTIPAQFTTVTRRVLANAGGFTEWREVLCDTDVTSDLIRRVQQALISNGYNVGDSGADNQMGAASKAALNKYQKDNGLPIGPLNNETLKALGVK